MVRSRARIGSQNSVCERLVFKPVQINLARATIRSRLPFLLRSLLLLAVLVSSQAQSLTQITACYSGTITQLNDPDYPIATSTPPPFNVGDLWSYSVTTNAVTFIGGVAPSSYNYSIVSVTFQAGSGTWTTQATNGGNLIITTATANANYDTIYSSALLSSNRASSAFNPVSLAMERQS